MASGMFNKGKERLLAEVVWGTSDLRWMLLDDTYTFSADHNYVGDVSAYEFDGANYVRKTISTPTIEEDDTNDRAEAKSDNVTWTSLGAGTNPALGILLYLYDASDAAAEIIYWGEFSGGAVNGNGGDFTVNQPTDGWFYI